MKLLLNKIFKQNNADKIEQTAFDLALVQMVDTILPKKSFENQLETRILEMAAIENENSTLPKKAGRYLFNSPIRKFSLVGLTIVLIMAISLLVSPSLRVMAENLFSFWKKVDNQQVITPIPEVPAVDPEEIPAIVESLQKEIKSTQQAPAENSEEEYIIKLPTLLPEGYRIVTVSNGPNGNAWVDLSSRNKGVYLIVNIQPASLVENSIIGPADKIEKVAINNITGEYVRGGFGVGPFMSGHIKEADAEKITWIDDSSIHKLTWNDGNMNYLLIYAGSGSPGNPRYLGKNDMAKIAASMQPFVNGIRPSVESFVPDNGKDESVFENIKDFSVLQDLVNFHVAEPSYLPDKYSFDGAEVPFTGTAIFEYFSCTPDPGEFDYEKQFEFVLQMNNISENQLAESELFIDEIGEDAVIETILIDGLEVQYLKGGWANNSNIADDSYQNETRVWDNNAHWHRMKWYKDGSLFSLQYYAVTQPDYQGSCALTKEDLIKFVEGLQ